MNNSITKPHVVEGVEEQDSQRIFSVVVKFIL